MRCQSPLRVGGRDERPSPTASTFERDRLRRRSHSGRVVSPFAAPSRPGRLALTDLLAGLVGHWVGLGPSFTVTYIIARWVTFVNQTRSVHSFFVGIALISPSYQSSERPAAAESRRRSLRRGFTGVGKGG